VDVSDEELDRAVGVLRAGGLVAFPTETVYGLGADAASPAAVRHLFEVKGRPADHPVIVHLAHRSSPDETLDGWAVDRSEAARALAAAWWPGPLTLVLPRGPRVPDVVTGGAATVGVRVPDQPVAQRLLTRFAGGLAAPSANRFGRVSPTTAGHVRADLGTDVDLILDDGPCRVGVESTIVDCTTDPPAILRLGAVPRDAVAAVVGAPVAARTDGATPAPGTRASHYTPDARVELVAEDAVPSRAEALLATGARVGLLALAVPAGVPDAVVVLGDAQTVEALAHGLYARLRDADEGGLDVVLAVAPPAVGLGAAVGDRLTRAARPPR
jgi:L-threonylcarbamoyladenylate synthase